MKIECPSVLQLWNVHHSRNSGMSISPATLECPSAPQPWNVRRSCDSGMSVCPATLGCPSVLQPEFLWVLQLWNVRQSCNSRKSVSPTGFNTQTVTKENNISRKVFTVLKSRCFWSDLTKWPPDAYWHALTRLRIFFASSDSISVAMDAVTSSTARCSSEINSGSMQCALTLT